MKDLIFSLAITIGAILGALSRFYLTEWSKVQFGTKFPYATFAINVTGCLMIGIFWEVSNRTSNYSQELDLLIRIGFLGSYTTFSTYEFDTFGLWRNQQAIAAIFYWLGSICFGLLAVFLGIAIAKLV